MSIRKEKKRKNRNIPESKKKKTLKCDISNAIYWTKEQIKKGVLSFIGSTAIYRIDVQQLIEFFFSVVIHSYFYQIAV